MTDCFVNDSRHKLNGTTSVNPYTCMINLVRDFVDRIWDIRSFADDDIAGFEAFRETQALGIVCLTCQMNI